MLHEVSQWLYRTVRLWMLLLALLVFAYFVAMVLPAEAVRSQSVIGSLPSPDTSLLYSAGDLYSMAREYGAEGRAYYVRARYTFDVVWPLAYAAFLVTSLTVVYGRLYVPRVFYLINVLPLAAADFDFLENIAAGWFMHRYPLDSPVLAAVAPVATLSKWLLIALSFLALIVGVIMLAIPGFRRSAREG
ncbi:MAG TPA: hypothetical protein VK905_05580 [Bacillota bacterium]|nr:hypothetical protein [Bacillota bacterium]